MVGKILVKEGNFPNKGGGLIYLTFEDTFKKDENLKLLDKKTGNKLTSKFRLNNFSGKENQIISLELNDSYQEIVIVGAGKIKEFNLGKWKGLVADSLRHLQRKKLQSATVFYQEELADNFFEIGKELALAFYLTNYRFDRYKSEKERKKFKKIEVLDFIINPKIISGSTKVIREINLGIDYGRLISEGIYLTCDLVNQPASSLHPETLVEEAFKIEKESKGKVKVEVLDEGECRRLGMGAFLGVGQGSERKPKFIVLHYQDASTKIFPQVNSSSHSSNIHSRQNFVSASSKKESVCLIGKSITFDSGGLSLKPSEAMETMKMDMAGGAAVLGVFKILAGMDDSKIPREVYGILPACENMPSGKAIRPGDVVTALNGKTIEVLNTDAEGRLTLADALSYAEKYLNPEIIIDLATLTGACMVALGKEIAGMFGNDERLLQSFKKIAQQEKEELWPMPLFLPYAEKLKSEVADLKNITGDRWAGAITAALFLKEFVSKAKWLHLDIAGPAFNDGKTKGTFLKGATGWGVVSLIEFLNKK